jgi:hypothetical protein
MEIGAAILLGLFLCFIAEAGFPRTALSIFCPIAAPFLLWHWWSKKRRGMSTSDISDL